MNVNEFVAKYRNIKDPEKKEAFLFANIKPRGYQSYANKIAKAESIVKTTMFRDGRVNVNTPIQYYLTQMTIIRTWTDLEVSPENMLAQFDALDEYGLIDEIINKIIPEHEVASFNAVLSMVRDDFMTNKYGAHALWDEVIELVNRISKDMTEPVQNLISRVETNDGDAQHSST